MDTSEESHFTTGCVLTTENPWKVDVRKRIKTKTYKWQAKGWIEAFEAHEKATYVKEGSKYDSVSIHGLEPLRYRATRPGVGERSDEDEVA